MALSHDEIRDLLYGALNKDRTDDEMSIWIADVFDTDFVYEKEGEKWRAPYTLNEDGAITIGTPERVKVDYVKFAELRDVAVLRVGTFTAANGQGVTFTDADLDEIVNNFAAIPDNRIPLVAGHSEGEAGEIVNALTFGAPAGAYMTGLKKKDIAGVPTLVADFGELAEDAVDKVGKQLVRLSAEVHPNFVDNEGVSHGQTLLRVAAVGRSSIRELPDMTEANLAFSEDGTGDEKMIVFLHEDTDDSIKTQTGGSDMDSKVLDMQKERDAETAKLAEAELALADAKKETAKLKESQEAAVKKLTETQLKAKTEKIDGLLTKLGESGKVPPAVTAILQKFMETLEDDSGKVMKFSDAADAPEQTPLDCFADILGGAKPLIQLGEEIEGGPADDADVEAGIAKLMEADKDLGYAQAAVKFSEKHPEAFR